MNKKEIFISHRRTDKIFADILLDFLVRCGIRSENIFCSSLPGNDIEYEISAEIKDALKTSKLNFAILSDEYYSSPYCQNEAGVIWFNETKKILICLPEISEEFLEGFLNSENKIRRFNSKDDILAISDILKAEIPEFVSNHAKLNANIDKLITEYQNRIDLRKPTIVLSKNDTGTNQLEQKIFNNDFSGDEIIALKYLYDKQCKFLSDNSDDFTVWKSNNGIEKESNVYVPEFFVEDGLAKYIYDEYLDSPNGFTLEIKTYRDLRKLSAKAIDFLEKVIAKYQISYQQADTNPVDKLIEKGFSDREILLLKYIIDTERVKLFCVWQENDEVSKIKAWEDINSIIHEMSSNYKSTLERFEIRKLIQVSAFTSSNNPKDISLETMFLIIF